MSSLFDDYEPEDYASKVRRTKDGRPYVLADPDWSEPHLDFTPKPGEHRGPSAIYTRVTTYISCLEDTYALGQWQERQVTLGLATRVSLIARAQRVDVNNEKAARYELNAIATAAREVAGWHEKADLGTDFHEIAREYDNGRRNWGNLADTSKKMLAAYIVATKGWKYEHIEQGMINDEARTFGTPDRLRITASGLREPTPGIHGGWRHDGIARPLLRVADIKTGRIDFGWQKMELQLAAYAISKLYDPDTGIRTELDIDTTTAEIVHVPYGEGMCTVYPISLGPAIEALTDLIPRVRAWRARTPAWVPAGQGPTSSGLAAAWSPLPPEVV